MDAPIFVWSLGLIGGVGFALILAALLEDWRNPANAYTGWNARNR